MYSCDICVATRQSITCIYYNNTINLIYAIQIHVYLMTCCFLFRRLSRGNINNNNCDISRRCCDIYRQRICLRHFPSTMRHFPSTMRHIPAVRFTTYSADCDIIRRRCDIFRRLWRFPAMRHFPALHRFLKSTAIQLQNMVCIETRDL